MKKTCFFVAVWAYLGRGQQEKLNSIALFLVVLLGTAFASADLLDIYESDGILQDFIVFEGDIVEIDTGASPPQISVDAFPVGYLYKGRVMDGAAVFDFDDVSIAKNVSITVTGSRPLVLSARGDMTVGSHFDVSAGVGGGGTGGSGGDSSAGGVGGVGGAGYLPAVRTGSG